MVLFKYVKHTRANKDVPHLFLDTGKTCYAIGSTLPPVPSQGEGEMAVEEGEESKTRPEPEEEEQYLVKWVGWSHLHNTWETGESVIDYVEG